MKIAYSDFFKIQDKLIPVIEWIKNHPNVEKIVIDKNDFKFFDGEEESPASIVEFNINENVMVKLTDHGRRCLYKAYENLKAIYGENLGYDYKPPDEDENGWSEWQMWRLMAELGGKNISMGFNPPFEPTIKIIVGSK
jgi:hypothetical protein